MDEEIPLDSEDWFYESFHRYNILQMYELERIPDKITQFNSTSVLVTGRNDSKNNHELLELELPVKLTISESNEGLCKANDFKILSGGNSRNLIYDVKPIVGENLIFTSEYNLNGVQTYQSNGNVIIEKQTRVNQLDIQTPNITFDEDYTKMFLSKTSRDEIINVDMKTENITSKLKLPDMPSNDANHDNIKCLFNNELFIILQENNGKLFTSDLRCPNTWNLINSLDLHKDWPSYWCMQTMETKLGLMSSLGYFYLLDIRNMNTCYLKCELPIRRNNINKIDFKFNPLNKFIISVNNFDNYIFIYDVHLDKNVKLIFKHDGHMRSEDYELREGKENSISDHIWLSNIRSNLITSISLNKSLNSWQYN